MVLSCDKARSELSNYIDGNLVREAREALEAHVAACRRCAAALAGMRNVVALAGDERAFALPAGFSERLERRLKGAPGVPAVVIPAVRGGQRSALRTSLVWATAAGVLFAALSVLEARNPNAWRPKSWHSQPALRIPSGEVAINPEGKLFHEPDCEYLEAGSELVSGAVAVRRGYTPCVRCEGALLAHKPEARRRDQVVVAALRPRTP